MLSKKDLKVVIKTKEREREREREREKKIHLYDLKKKEATNKKSKNLIFFSNFYNFFYKEKL